MNRKGDGKMISKEILEKFQKAMGEDKCYSCNHYGFDHLGNDRCLIDSDNDEGDRCEDFDPVDDSEVIGFVSEHNEKD